MAISMVRKPSETPNINNISDIIPFRYAYGGQNGYVKGKGRELDYTALGTQFTIGSGRVVLDGVESDIDSDGVIINIDSVSETRYYVVYYNVNLATNTTTIMSQYATGSYPTIEKGDDLTASPEGSANLVLYKFTATSGIISNVEKVVKEIMYSLADYNNAKGTIEERLSKLGFDEDDIKDTQGNIVGHIKRQGNYVLGQIDSFEWSGNLVLPEKFRPINSISFGIDGYISLSGTAQSMYQIETSDVGGRVASIVILNTGGVSIRKETAYSSATVQSPQAGAIRLEAQTTLLAPCYFGYEANPL